MSFDVFLNFDGNCREAVAFYSEVFQVRVTGEIMTFGQNPEASAVDKDRVLYASLPVFGSNLMFSDCPTGATFVQGNNVSLTLGSANPAEITRIFQALAAGGTAVMPLQKTFFSELFGMVCDKFGIHWQLALSPEQAA